MVTLRRIESCPQIVPEVHPVQENANTGRIAGQRSLSVPAWLDRIPRVLPHGFFDPPENAALGFSALDLAVPAGQPPARNPVITVAPPAMDGLFIDMADLQQTESGHDSQAAFTQKAFYARAADGSLYRLKLNQRPTTTVHEFIVARLLAALGFDAAMPQTRLVSGDVVPQAAGDVWLASPVIEGYRDLGPFLQEEGISHVAPSQRPAYQALKDACDAAQAQAAQIREGPGIRDLLMKYPKGSFGALTAQQHALLQPLRDCSRHALQCQYKMFKLLPHEFARELMRAYYIADIVANWDFMNHGLGNFGFVVRDGKASGWVVDGGNSGPIGFGGGLKTESSLLARGPACIDDPFARTPGPASPHAYMHDDIPADDALLLDHVSRTYALTGSLPRSPAFSPFIQKIIHDEQVREEVGVKFSAPLEAMEVAWRLKALPPGRVQACMQALFDQGLAHPDPAIRRLFTPEVTRFANAQALSDSYLRRIEAIIARAEDGGHLQRWADTHPLQAMVTRRNSRTGSF